MADFLFILWKTWLRHEGTSFGFFDGCIPLDKCSEKISSWCWFIKKNLSYLLFDNPTLLLR